MTEIETINRVNALASDPRTHSHQLVSLQKRELERRLERIRL